MKMIPPYPHETGSMAEKRIFDRLRIIFNSPNDQPMTAFHSLSVTDHQKKRVGEIDFLLWGPPGLFVLEVKGGNVCCKKGIWTFENRYGVKSSSGQGPFQQAESALQGLITKLKKQFGSETISSIPIGYGVIFPDCQWQVDGAEWDNAVWVDARRLNGINHWLTALFSYWQKRQPHTLEPDSNLVEKLSGFLRPQFETVETLFCRICRNREQRAILTRDQMKFIDVIQANKKILCFGGAGTGKTLMAMELAKLWTHEGEKVVMPCASRWQKRYLETRFLVPGLTLTTIQAIEVDAQRAGICQFDALIVDEGQDLFFRKDMEKLVRFIKGGLEEGHWAIFHDINNQADPSHSPEPEILSFLESLNPARIPLKTNCRNTLNIIDQVKTCLGADMGAKGIGQGPAVRQRIADSPQKAAAILTQELTYILDSGQISADSITILSPYSFDKSCAGLLDPEWRRQVCILDDFAIRNFPPRQISFSQIFHFKGFENEVIILVDLSFPKDQTPKHPLHYIGMSRPRTLLSMIFHPASLGVKSLTPRTPSSQNGG